MRRLGLPLFLLAFVLGPWLTAQPAAANAPQNSFTADAVSTWQTNGVVNAMVSSGGKVFAAGDFTQLRPPGAASGAGGSVDRTDLAVLDGATGAPTSCVLDVARGTGTAYVRALALSPNGATLYVGGIFSTIKGQARQNVAAVDIATCSVLAFNPKPTSFVYAITATSSRVYLGGAFLNIGTTPRTRLAALNLDGSLITTWSPTADDAVLALNTDPSNGNLIVGGQFNRINATLTPTLAVINGGSGVLAKAYAANFFPWTDGFGARRYGNSTTKSIAVDASGFYIGNECNCAQTDNFEGRAAFSWGTYDQRWRDRCSGATQAVLPYNGVLFSASHAHNCATEGWFPDGARHHFLSETTAGKQIVPWFPDTDDGFGEHIGPRTLAVANAGGSAYLWSGGEFTTVNGIPQQGLTRFAKTPDVGAPVAMTTPTAVAATTGTTVTWKTSLDTDDAVLSYQLFRADKGTTTPIATVSGTSWIWSRPSLSYRDTTTVAGKSYSYTVRAVDPAGNKTAASSPVTVTAK